MRSLLALAFGLALALSCGAQIYKWTDSSGKVHYGDQPPDDVKKEELRIRIPSYDGPVQVTDWSAVIRKKTSSAPASDGITMYSTDWCPHCKNARNYFAANAIRYREVNVESSESGRKEFEELGGGGVPLILIGQKVMRGFSPESFEYYRKKS
jgi:glutaredoxin